MESPKTIPRSGTPATVPSYQDLLNQGIEHCQGLGSDHWTDYNQHDPGVTILQQLCFALTDLAYRSDFDIADIMAVAEGEKPPEQPLYTGDRILTSCPLTKPDYRKFLYDRIDGVKNAWLVKVPDHPLDVQGLYEVLIETREDIGKEQEPRILREVRQCMRGTRSLGEDVDDIRILQVQPIRVEATIEIDPKADPSDVLAQVLFGIQDSLIPFPSVQIIDELFQKETPDQIWNGPMLTHGALKPESLVERRDSIEVQEIAHIILQTPGVKRVKHLRAGTADDKGNFVNPKATSSGSIKILPGHLPRLYPKILEPQPSYSIGVELEGEFKCRVDTRAVSVRIQAMDMAMHNRIAYAAVSLQASSYLKVPVGEFRNVADYFSLQHQFPTVYGLSKYGAANKVMEGLELVAKPDDRAARVRQLRAYLLFFEQPLADYLAQLANVGHLFSLDEGLEHSYFYQPLAHHPPRPSDPEQITEVLVQPTSAVPKSTAHYVVWVLGQRGEIVFATPSLASHTEAERIRLQILENGQNKYNYLASATAPNRVHLALHNATGTFLALGHERFTSIAHAHAAAARWSSFMAQRAASERRSESAVRIVRREDLGVQIVDDQSEIVLTGSPIYTQEERTRRIGEILAYGIDRGNYRVRRGAAGGFSVDLHSVNPSIIDSNNTGPPNTDPQKGRDERIAQGQQLFMTEADAEEGVDALVTLIRRMAEREAVRDRHLVPLARTAETDSSPLRSYQQGLTRLWQHEDREYLRRRNKILNHLLARFGEHFDDGILERLDLRPFGEKDDFFREMIRWKIEFLRHYVGKKDDDKLALHQERDLGGGRGLGFDYGEAEDSSTLSGLGRRTSLLLGLRGHYNHGEYSLQQTAATDPGFSYLEKQVRLKSEEVKDDRGNAVTVCRQHIAGPWPKDEPDLNDLHHNFVFSSEDSSILSQLLSSGLARESYRLYAAGGQHHILFYPPDSKQAIEIHHTHSRAEAERSLTALLAYLHGLNRSAAHSYSGERMYVIEHILLRPHGHSGKCCVSIDGPQSRSQPGSGAHLRSTLVDRSRKDEHKKLILDHGRNANNYRVIRHNTGKHSVELWYQERPIATAWTMFESEIEANQAIRLLVELVHSHQTQPRPAENHVPARPHAPIPAIAASDDFYSHRVSVFLPNWPARFQNAEFRLYAEQLIYENAPAHLAIDCFWLTCQEMAEFEKLHSLWKSVKRTVQLRDEADNPANSPDQSSQLNEAAAKLTDLIRVLQKKQPRDKSPKDRPAEDELPDDRPHRPDASDSSEEAGEL
jgi:hypothetical protein